MLQGLKNLFTKKFELTRPPVNTPDIALLFNQEYHWVFDHDNSVSSPTAFTGIFTDQRFYMWFRNHEHGTPSIVTTENIHPVNFSRRARLQGKLHTTSPDQLVELDKMKGNGVKSERRRVRVIFPYYKESKQNQWDVRTPIKISAWIYCDSNELWTPRFQFDAEMWRGRPGSAYKPVTVHRDNRPHINTYFAPTRGVAQPCKFNPSVFDYSRFKRQMGADESYHYEVVAEKEAKRRDESSKRLPPALPQVS